MVVDGRLDGILLRMGGWFVVVGVWLGSHVPWIRRRFTHLISKTSPSRVYPARVVLASRSHPSRGAESRGQSGRMRLGV